LRDFSHFVQLLDTTTSTNKKVLYLREYFDSATDKDKITAIALLSGRRPKRSVPTAMLRKWAAEESGIPDWLFEESYHVVGDLAETIALVLPPGKDTSDRKLFDWLIQLKELSTADDDQKKDFVTSAWKKLDKGGRFVFNKLITGGFRIGISQKLMVRALSAHTGIEENELAHRLMGKWSPFDTGFKELIYAEDEAAKRSRPYPFYLAYPLEDEKDASGPAQDWSAEFKWDGIRSQVIVRAGELYIWSRGEELVTHSYPDLAFFADILPDGTAIDGELVAWEDCRPLPFNRLQKRLNRKTTSAALIRKVPVAIVAYDLVEWEGRDIRDRSFQERRALLKNLCEKSGHPQLIFSKEIEWEKWGELDDLRRNARKYNSEGIMLKKRDSVYKSGRRRGEWWKWKTDPMLADGVLLYAMRGKGRRTNLFTDYTFAAWDGELLVPFAKAYSGLTDDEFRSVTSFVRRNTIERHGPVHAVKPKLVFEIAFEDIAPSSRHKSGLALRFPRMKRWRKDKPPEEATTLEELKALLKIRQKTPE